MRHSPELPRLPHWSGETAPIDFGDWITCLHTYMSDLSPTSEQWWDLTLSTAKTWYQEHMQMTPIQRLSHLPVMSELLKQRKWGRLERRAASLLMASLPEQLREECLPMPWESSTRPCCSTSLVASQSAVRSLPHWKALLNVPQFLLQSPSSANGFVGKDRPVLEMSYWLTRTVPTHQTVSQYSEHLLAELEQMGQQAKRREAPPEGPPKLRKFEENKGHDQVKPSGKSSEDPESRRKPCRFFLTDNGCKRGKNCQFQHTLDNQERCWTSCGSKGHFAPGCPRAEDGKPKGF